MIYHEYGQVSETLLSFSVTNAIVFFSWITVDYHKTNQFNFLDDQAQSWAAVDHSVKI